MNNERRFDWFWRKVRIPADVITGHWEWEGQRNWHGIGWFCDHEAQRWAWKYANNVKMRHLKGLVVTQICGRRTCVNPAHLVATVPNTPRLGAAAKGRHQAVSP